MSFFTELKRRNVFKVGVAYVVATWLIAQVVNVVNEPLGLPAWFDTAVIYLLVDDYLQYSNQAPVIPEAATSDSTSPPAPENRPAESVRGVLPNSVAVLAFENLSPDPDNAYFAAGIHEEVLNCLAKIKSLNVIARTTMLRYKDSGKGIEEIAKELNVKTVMEGSVRYASNRVRITAQLIDPESGAHLWSEAYERNFDDVFAIQADIAENIANALKAEFSLAEQATIVNRPTTSSEAYSLYLQAIAITTIKSLCCLPASKSAWAAGSWLRPPSAITTVRWNCCKRRW